MAHFLKKEIIVGWGDNQNDVSINIANDWIRTEVVYLPSDCTVWTPYITTI